MPQSNPRVTHVYRLPAATSASLSDGRGASETTLRRRRAAGTRYGNYLCPECLLTKFTAIGNVERGMPPELELVNIAVNTFI
ncbi:hypothetical protein GWI33_019040 [Rhynchophorus ferrugineus]|uniref:Uncharacterized protein n=1 Tax=Rhynchophorus ferrugineus TaxID=354439 RepID=A0A834HS82_RHYFE|nr:hypothetical protein GWI33_019040 [Rhynchophorus ferrugineus]